MRSNGTCSWIIVLRWHMFPTNRAYCNHISLITVSAMARHLVRKNLYIYPWFLVSYIVSLSSTSLNVETHWKVSNSRLGSASTFGQVETCTRKNENGMQLTMLQACLPFASSTKDATSTTHHLVRWWWNNYWNLLKLGQTTLCTTMMIVTSTSY